MAKKSTRKPAKRSTSKKYVKKEQVKEKQVEENSINEDKVLIYAILGLVVVFSFFLLANYYLKPDENPMLQIETKMYNGFLFEKVGGVWQTNVTIKDWFQDRQDSYKILFHYTPDEVEHIESMKNSRNESSARNILLDAKYIYITMDPKYPSAVVLSEVEIEKILSQVFLLDAQPAINKPDNRTTVPVITCEDLKPLVRVIELRLGDETRIYNDHGCLIVEGTDPDELLKAADRFAFELLKIIE